MTTFDDQAARVKHDHHTTWGAVVRQLREPPVAETKENLPWLKLATFGNRASANGCLRTNSNLVSVYGVEGDYDSGEVPIQEAADRLRFFGVAAVFHSSAGHSPEFHKWRVLAPLSKAIKPRERAAYTYALSQLLGGILEPESWRIPSQAFHYGRVKDNPHYDVIAFDGQPLDVCVEPIEPPPTIVLEPGEEWTTKPVSKWKGPENDEELVALALRAVSHATLHGESASFADLWSANEPALAKFYPTHTKGETYDRSGADFALAMRLAFWTGRDCARIERLMLKSALRRPKWDRDGYLRTTILKAAVETKEVLRGGAAPAATLEDFTTLVSSGDVVQEAPEAQTRPELVMSLDEMLRDLVLVNRDGVIYHRRTGRVVKLQHAPVVFAASRIEIQDGDKIRVAPVFDLWLRHKRRVTRDVLVWDPAAGELCEPLEAEDNAQDAVNTWRPIPHELPAGWKARAKWFVQHLEFLIPDEEERKLFVQWLSHALHKPAELPHFAVLMIATTPGVGRSWLAIALQRAFYGQAALGVDLNGVLAGQFNGRLSQKVLAVVEEAREGADSNRHSRANTLKRVITEPFRRINPKFGAEVTERNCARWLLFSNHWSAVPIDDRDRRVFVIENPSEPRDRTYYRGLYGCLEDPDFGASVRQWLLEVDLKGFDPGAPPPDNDARQQVIHAVSTPVDLAVQAFVEDCQAPLTTRRVIDAYVRAQVSGPLNTNHVTHAIENAGMVSVGGKRGRRKIGGRREALVIVRPSAELNRRTVEATPTPGLEPLIGAPEGFSDV
ncbi:MAG: DUF5906 domain-containing protein [Pseudomonadales bacterium]